MKIAFTKEELLKGLNIVMKAVAANTTMPILKCILMDAASNTIKLMSNDNELSIETIISGTTYEPGLVAIDARIFYEIVKRLPGELVDLEVNDRFLATLKCEKSKFNIPAQDGSQFPFPDESKSNYSLGMSQFTLKEMIRQTIFALNLSEKNKLLTGEMFEIKDGILRIVAIDGNRIAIRRLKLGMEHENRQAIIPGKSLNEISKLLSDNLEDQVTVHFSENLIMFELEATKVYTRLIEGDYFRVDNMISSDFNTKVEINKKVFFDCLDRANLLVKEGEKRPLILDIADGYMEMNIETSLGSMNDTVEIEKDGDDLRIGFNPKFIMDAIRVVDEENIKLNLISKRAPCYIKDDDQSYMYIVMPINIL